MSEKWVYNERVNIQVREQAAHSLLPTVNLILVSIYMWRTWGCLHHDWWVLLHSPPPVLFPPHLVPLPGSLCCIPPTA